AGVAMALEIRDRMVLDDIDSIVEPDGHGVSRAVDSGRIHERGCKCQRQDAQPALEQASFPAVKIRAPRTSLDALLLRRPFEQFGEHERADEHRTEDETDVQVHPKRFDSRQEQQSAPADRSLVMPPEQPKENAEEEEREAFRTNRSARSKDRHQN